MKSPPSPFPHSIFPFVTCEPPLTTAQFTKPGGFMSKAIRTALSLVGSLVLFSALTMAQAGGNADKGKNKEHHRSIEKVAFWRHHKDADKKPKQAQDTQAHSKQDQAKTAQMKPTSTKQAAEKKKQK